MDLIIGLDLSLDHYGLVLMDKESGKVLDIGYLTNKKKYYHPKNYPLAKLWRGKGKHESKENYQIARLHHRNLLIDEIVTYIITKYWPDNTYCAIEDYAFAAKSGSTYQTGEMGGMFRYNFCKNRIKLRYLDPFSIKLWATGNGHASKLDVYTAALAYGFDGDVDKLGVYKKVKNKKTGLDVTDLDGVSTDICDAFFLANILRTELLVKDGIILTKDIDEQCRKVLLRVTKSNPVGLIDRDFVELKVD